MKSIAMLALILGVSLCATVGVYASDGAGHKHHAHHRAADLYFPLSPKAVALVPAPVVVPAARETDGLSRNREDCNEGCIDN